MDWPYQESLYVAWEWSDGSELNYQQWGPLEPYENNGF